jgi:hypothetical protein
MFHNIFVCMSRETHRKFYNLLPYKKQNKRLHYTDWATRLTSSYLIVVF